MKNNLTTQYTSFCLKIAYVPAIRTRANPMHPLVNRHAPTHEIPARAFEHETKPTDIQMNEMKYDHSSTFIRSSLS